MLRIFNYERVRLAEQNFKLLKLFSGIENMKSSYAFRFDFFIQNYIELKISKLVHCQDAIRPFGSKILKSGSEKANKNGVLK